MSANRIEVSKAMWQWAGQVASISQLRADIREKFPQMVYWRKATNFKAVRGI
jgi:hypothetical protein